MTFIEECGKVYMRELKKDHNREIDAPDYMPQSAFPDCASRGKALSERAYRAVDNFRTLCILLHREKTHGERRDTIKADLIRVMSDSQLEDITTAETGNELDSWWKD